MCTRALSATLSLVALLIVPSQVHGQEPTPSPQPSRTDATTEGSIVVDVFTDAACASFSYTITAWERRCTALGSRAQPTAASFYSVAQVRCGAPQGQTAFADLRIYNTTAATAVRCDTTVPSFVLSMRLDGACVALPPVPSDLVDFPSLTGFYRLRAADCSLAPEGTVFTLRRYSAAGCSGTLVGIDSLQVGECTRNGFQGTLNATLEKATTNANAFNVLAWPATPPSDGCSGSADSAETLVLAVPPRQVTDAATEGCTPASRPAGAFVTLREAPQFTPPNAGAQPEELSSVAVAFIILAALAVLGLGYYGLLRNNLLCKAAPVQVKGRPPRVDVTAPRVPASVKNPVEQRGAAVVVVPNVLNAVGAGVKEFK
jgi:hypothetical protein